MQSFDITPPKSFLSIIIIIHHALNELVARGFALAGLYPSLKNTREPVGLFRTDEKRPDGLTLVPWQSGKSLC